MSHLCNLGLVVMKLIMLILLFIIGSLIISSTFQFFPVTLQCIILAGVLFLGSIMKINVIDLPDFQFDFNTFVFVCLITPAIIDYIVGVYPHIEFFQKNFSLVYDIFENNINEFFQKNFNGMDENVKNFYITSLVYFFILKSLILQGIHKIHIGFIHLDYVLILTYINNVVIQPLLNLYLKNK